MKLRNLRREIAALKPLVKWGMRINSRRYLPLADRLERLEEKERISARSLGVESADLGRGTGPSDKEPKCETLLMHC